MAPLSVDARTAAAIGAGWLRRALAPTSALGRRREAGQGVYGPGDEARASAQIRRVAALAQALSRAAVDRLRAVLREIPDPAAILASARGGARLADLDFYELARFADGAHALAEGWDAAGGPEDERPPRVPGLRAILAPGHSGAGFYLADAYAPGLAQARRAFAQVEAAFEAERGRAASRVRAQFGIDASGDELVLLRSVHDGPLPRDVLVLRETATYRVLTLRADVPGRDGALLRLADAEDAARLALSERIVREAGEVEEAARALSAVDGVLARVAFAQRWGGCIPELAPGRIVFEAGTFAPLAEQLAARGRPYTPLTIDLRGVAVVTGPNVGGKSAALATAAFLCACAAHGVPPPARAAALPLLEAIVWVGGDEDAERGELLSSFADEVVRASDALAASSPHALILLDEFGRTTGAREGNALLVAILEALRARGALALAATHAEGVAAAADVPHFRIAGLPSGVSPAPTTGDRRERLEAVLAAIGAAMDYRLVRADDDAADRSDALVLAALLGLDDAVVERAQALYGRER